MIHRLCLSIRWKYYQVKRWFITESIELLAPGYLSFSDAVLDEVLRLREDNANLFQELHAALDTVDGAHQQIKELKKRKRRKK